MARQRRGTNNGPMTPGALGAPTPRRSPLFHPDAPVTGTQDPADRYDSEDGYGDSNTNGAMQPKAFTQSWTRRAMWMPAVRNLGHLGTDAPARQAAQETKAALKSTVVVRSKNERKTPFNPFSESIIVTRTHRGHHMRTRRAVIDLCLIGAAGTAVVYGTGHTLPVPHNFIGIISRDIHHSTNSAAANLPSQAQASAPSPVVTEAVPAPIITKESATQNVPDVTTIRLAAGKVICENTLRPVTIEPTDNLSPLRAMERTLGTPKAGDFDYATSMPSTVANDFWKDVQNLNHHSIPEATGVEFQAPIDCTMS